MNQPQTTKLKLEKEQPEPLKIYFMIVRQSKIDVPNEAVLAVLSYTLEDALRKARQQAQKFNVIYHGQNIEVNEMLKKLQLEGLIAPPVKGVKTAKPKSTKQQFLWNLQMIMEDYVKSKKDKETLKKIISKVGKTKTKLK